MKIRIYLNANYYSIDAIKKLTKENPVEIEFYEVGDLVNNLANEGEDNILPEDQLKYNKNRNLKISNFFVSPKMKEKEKISENETSKKASSRNRAGKIKNSINDINRKLNKIGKVDDGFYKNDDDVSTKYMSLITSNPSKRKASPTTSNISRNLKLKKKSKNASNKIHNLKVFDNLLNKIN